jgi:hypothetical protein
MAARDADKRLGQLPVTDPHRPKLTDRIGLKGAKLEARARKFLTLKPESFWGSTARQLSEPEPSYKARLWALTSHLFTRQSPVVLKCPTYAPGSKTNHVATTPAEYIRQFDQLNGLKGPHSEDDSPC